MILQSRITTALNLTLEGSVGSFRVGIRQDRYGSILVKYFLTHIGLNLSIGSNAKILKHIAPVREFFDFNTLEFDEIMQRDIDDARVSSELIPYLLDSRSRDLVKLFPPIIVVVLPVKQYENRPEDRYPKVEMSEDDSGSPDYKLHITRSGSVGQEVFQFEQPIQHGKTFEHDLTRLKLNTNSCKLVIVDGQHRAMALLALYRNLKDEWSDAKRRPFQDYYEEWTPNYIRQFELEQISLPVMFCTFPSLDETYIGDYDVKKAARSIFLTLNKTARKVSESRNRLLDDNDLIAMFLRDTLSTIKRKDALSKHSLRIFNVELDQVQDRTKIESPIAVTGVNHIYYLIEHLLLNKGDDDVNGAKPRSGKFYKRTDFGAYGGFERLDGRNVLGAENSDATSRNFYSTGAGDKLTEQFRERIGRFIVASFERFRPFEAHANSVLWLEQQLAVQENQKLRPILFEGQGIGRVFSAHRENLRDKLRNKEFEDEATKIQEIAARLDATNSLVYASIDKLKNRRAEKFLEEVTDKSKLRTDGNGYHTNIVRFINDLYDNVFTTVAFQTALISGFFGEVERANRDLAKNGLSPLDLEGTFDDYLSSLNEFFIPKSSSQFRRLVNLFGGVLEGEIREWKLVRSPHTFREVVFQGEMQPDQWPKYKYLILEIWRPDGEAIKDTVEAERNKCRDQIFTSLHDEYREAYLQKELKREENLSETEREAILEDTYNAFKEFLRNLGWKVPDIPTKKIMQERTSKRIDDAEAEKDPTEETWPSIDG